MKQKRQKKILELIGTHNIDTQEELLARLKKSGYEATQATISRDIREMNIIKASTGKGSYKYVTQSDTGKGGLLGNRFYAILKEAIKNVDYAQNIVVIKAFPGMASAAGTAIDAMSLSEVVGSVAGDDTLILIAKSTDAAERICTELSEDIS